MASGERLDGFLFVRLAWRSLLTKAPSHGEEPNTMTRLIVAAIHVGFGLCALAGVACQSTGVGDPCTPEQEYDKSFLGFSSTEVSVESESFQCESRLCLVDHFQGRVSCPYGQEPDGGGYQPATGCKIPGLGTPVDGIDSTGTPVDVVSGSPVATVLPECTNRKAADAVYCSCRCENVNGATNDGYNYCKCPDGFSCTQLVGSVGPQNQGLSGGYCVKNGAQYDPNACSPSTPGCVASEANCGTAQGVTAH
jgi:hypothetical protein